MKKLNGAGLIWGILFLAGCATHRAPPMANSRETVSIVITPGRSEREYSVETRMTTVRSSEPLPPCNTASTNLIDLLGCYGHADMLAVPHITVAAGQWGEIGVCSTNAPGHFSAMAQIGDEAVSVSHQAGVLLRVKVEPVTAHIVHVQGLVSVASEDRRGNVYYQHVVPIFADCELGKPMVVFRKEHSVPSQQTSVMVTEEWEYVHGTTNTCTLPSRSRAGK